MAKQISDDRESRNLIGTLFNLLKNFAAITTAIAALVIAGIFSWALFLRWYDPRPLITVQPFEVSEDSAKVCGLNGKNAQNLFVDRVNEIENDAILFHGNANSSKSGSLAGRIPMVPQVPVETSGYGITIGGIPIDGAAKLFSHARYDLWTITGDVMSSSEGCRVAVRLDRSGGSSEWSLAAPPGQPLQQAVRVSARHLLTLVHPELAGRALLGEALALADRPKAAAEVFAEADESFREWLLRRPGDIKAQEYLTASLVYQGWVDEAGALSAWFGSVRALREEVARDESAERAALGAGDSRIDRPACPARPSSASPEASLQADHIAMMGALALLKVPDVGSPSLSDYREAKRRLDCLRAANPKLPDYAINAGVASEQIAIVLATNPVGRQRTKAEDDEISREFKDALRLLLQGEALDPANPQTHTTIGVLLRQETKYNDALYARQAEAEMLLAMHENPANLRGLPYVLEFERAKSSSSADAFCEAIELLEPVQPDACVAPAPPAATPALQGKRSESQDSSGKTKDKKGVKGGIFPRGIYANQTPASVTVIT